MIILFSCAIFSSTAVAQTPAGNIPEFIFYRPDNTLFTNKDIAAGKNILFVFFDITCDHCKHVIQTLSTHSKEFESVYIYLITLDNFSSVTYFLNENGKNLPDEKNVTLLQDKKNMFIKQFGPKKYPSVFLYGADYRLVHYSDEDENLVEFLKILKNSTN